MYTMPTSSPTDSSISQSFTINQDGKYHYVISFLNRGSDIAFSITIGGTVIKNSASGLGTADTIVGDIDVNANDTCAMSLAGVSTTYVGMIGITLSKIE